jgi:hypothetical protein
MPIGPATTIAISAVATVPKIGPAFAAISSGMEDSDMAGTEPATKTMKMMASVVAVAMAAMRAMARKARSGEKKLRDPVKLIDISSLLSRFSI